MELNYTNFNNQLTNFINLQKIKKIAVSLSGGADSMCLTFLLNKFCKQNNISLIAITVDHKLRKGSTIEANNIYRYLEKYGINHTVLTWNHNEIKSNIQKEARNVRYKMLCDFCNENGIENLFVAHTYDDQAETVLLRILRGSGIDGISGINSLIIMNEINIIRPLLAYTKTQILNFLKKENLLWFEDESNKNTKFDRVKVRNLITQLDKDFQLTDRLNLLSDNAKRAKNFIHSHVAEMFKKYCIIGELGCISINQADFNNLDEEIQLRLINHIIRYVRNEQVLYPSRLDSLKIALANLQKIGNEKFTLSNCKILLHDKIIYFYRESKYIESKKPLLRGDNLWDKRYQISINTKDFEISKLTKDFWHKIKPKNFIHKVPGDIIFSTPIIFSERKGIYILPLSNIINSTNILKLGIKIKVVHILPKSSFEIYC